MDRIVIGIDISKKKFDVAYMNINQQWHQRTFDNVPEGFKVFLKYLEDKKIEVMLLWKQQADTEKN